MKRILFIVIIFGLPYNLFCQGITNIWMAGYASWGGIPYGGITIDFINGIPVINYKYIPMNFSRGVATISDSLGNIKLYTNGIWIAGANDDTIVDGGGISPPVYNDSLGLWLPKTSLFLQKPNDTSTYYLFHCSFDNPPYDSLCLYLRQTTIDMNVNNGLGGVISKNNALINDNLNLGGINACKHGNGRDWWVTILERYSNCFYQLLVDPYNIGTPFKVCTGTYRPKNSLSSSYSPDGNKFALITLDSTYHYRLAVFDFDRCTGLFSNERTANFVGSQSEPAAVGLAFSPNSNMIYVSTYFRIYQFDCSQSNIQGTKIQVAEWDSFYSPSPPFAAMYEFMALAPDGKIYISTGNSTLVMHIIDQPDSPGVACNFIQHGLQLPAFSVSAPPNHPNYFLGDNGLCNNLGSNTPQTPEGALIRVFNNPTYDKFTLWFTPDKDVGVLEIYDVNGECIRKEYVAQWSQYKTVDIGALSAGVYFCRMRWPSGEGSVKVVRLE
nr:T9SS type A sorting domain-containing protein [Bacteroidota bacterium]